MGPENTLKPGAHTTVLAAPGGGLLASGIFPVGLVVAYPEAKHDPLKHPEGCKPHQPPAARERERERIAFPLVSAHVQPCQQQLPTTLVSLESTEKEMEREKKPTNNIL